MEPLPLITQRQAIELIGQERFDLLLKKGFIIPFGLEGLPSDLYDRKMVESGPIRFQISFKCWEETRVKGKRYFV